MTGLSGIFRQPFPEQVAAFRLHLGNLVPTSAWDDIERAAHDRGFMVAGAVKADLLADLGLAIDKAIEKGTTLEEFRKDFRAAVADHNWHGWTGEGTKGGEAWRTRVIYRTNLSTTYAAGRMAQLVAKNYPLWVYRHGASREPRKQHLGWDGLILPPDHPFWATHAPPNGWGCQCYVLGARSEAGAVRLGGRPDLHLPDGWQAPDPKTGAPKGIDKGWDYAPGRSVAATVALAAKKIAELPPEIGSDFGQSIAGIIDRQWPTWVADTMLGATHAPALAGTLSQEVISELALQGVPPKSAEIMVGPGLLKGPKAARHAQAGDDLTPLDWLTLPRLLRNPDAVLLDTRTGRLLFVLPGEPSARTSQIAVAMDYRLRRNGKTEAVNLAVSAYRPERGSLLGRLTGGLLTLLQGWLG